MIENSKFKVRVHREVFFEQIDCSVFIWCKSNDNNKSYCSVKMRGKLSYLWFTVIQFNKPAVDALCSYNLEKSFFTDLYDIEENDFLLYLVAHNHPVKHLKFIVGLYKLHTNQISTSELEQLVLDNIEDLL